MEKFSINDILALLLPGMFCLFCCNAIGLFAPSQLIWQVKNVLGSFNNNEFLSGSFYLLIAMLMGAAVQGIISIILNKQWYNKSQGLFKLTGYVFSTIPMLQHWLPFYNEDCKKITGHQYNGADILIEDEQLKKEKTVAIQGQYFDYVFYSLMSSQKNEEARTQQSFYFLYRSLYIVAIAMGGVACIYAFTAYIHTSYAQSKSLWGISITLFALAFILFKPLGVWYRKRMVRVLFYIYYIQKTTPLSSK